MYSITFTMEAIPTKHQELLQTLCELSTVMHTEKGFLDARICVHNQSHQFTFIEEWESEEDMHAYLHSRYFHVLRGAMQVLTETSEMTLGASSSVNPVR